MRLSTQTLRAEFKECLDKWSRNDINTSNLDEISDNILNLSAYLEEMIQEKIRLLEADFHDHVLTGEYLRSVTEGFDDLERLMRQRKTLSDIFENQLQNNTINMEMNTAENIIVQLKKHYEIYLNPLLNIMAKLENDYIAVASQTLLKRQDQLNKIQTHIQKIKIEQKNIKSKLLVFNKTKKLLEIEAKLKNMDIKRKIIQLTLHHDRLNIYYFNHDHPPELREIKQKADILKLELKKISEELYEE